MDFSTTFYKKNGCFIIFFTVTERCFSTGRLGNLMNLWKTPWLLCKKVLYYNKVLEKLK